MKLNFSMLFICTLVLTFSVAYLATAANFNVDLTADPLADPAEGDALNEQRPDAPWITQWWALEDQIHDNGGFTPSAPIDWLSDGSGGAITQESISTGAGLLASKGTTINLPDNGGDRGWTVITIDPTDNFNMSSAWGEVDQSDIDTYALIVIDSPEDRPNAELATTHDDHAQIWLNGTKIYNNSRWTGHQLEVDFEVVAPLKKGTNVLLYRCGESGGSDYYNAYFSAGGDGLTILPDSDDPAAFWAAIESVSTSVEPAGKLPAVWGEIKRRHR